MIFCADPTSRWSNQSESLLAMTNPSVSLGAKHEKRLAPPITQHIAGADRSEKKMAITPRS
jgi:hypothetical protein